MKIKQGNSYNVLKTVSYLVNTRLMRIIGVMITDDEEEIQQA